MDIQHKRTFTEKKDSISKLPENIIHLILSFLQLKCVVKTSILSRYSSDLIEWIEFVNVKGVGELVLDLSGNVRHSDSTDDDDIRWGMNKFRMPNSLFSCLSISSLTWCILEPPHDFKGFKALRSVALYGVTINSVQLGEIIRRSPLLEDLTMSYCNSLKSVKIDHLQLKILTLESCFDVEEMEIRTSNLKNL
ncbi:F-box/FBD/LRR-repeat protein At1g13570-like [Aristolochia californica]|uniref:F-box/FBD/LRR-repeat protein At1g13570-like n=1 Tax=Aristolochia californica TaxID=171875 RepID=UPI0035DAAA3B